MLNGTWACAVSDVHQAHGNACAVQRTNTTQAPLGKTIVMVCSAIRVNVDDFWFLASFVVWGSCATSAFRLYHKRLPQGTLPCGHDWSYRRKLRHLPPRRQRSTKNCNAKKGLVSSLFRTQKHQHQHLDEWNNSDNANENGALHWYHA